MPSNSRMRLHGPDPIEGAEHLTAVGVEFIPADYPKLRLTWEYVLNGRDILYPSGMRLEPVPGTSVDDRVHVGASFVRDLPLARLERAARMLVEYSVRQGTGGPPLGPTWGKPPTPDEISETARAMVRERFSDIDPEAGAGAARRWNRLIRLAEVVMEHQVARARGEKAPAAAVAEARGVAPSTVRSWLHQAKQEGFEPRPLVAGLDVFAEISSEDPAGALANEE
ncbi:hypothetical protein ACF090_13280 [Streptomyces sp. NPDC014892]|uniref:hypothetical protein n=1 Tax=Streptomyces sp. NPDC014892 TaxID=3364930 RepID=UPI0036FA6647